MAIPETLVILGFAVAAMIIVIALVHAMALDDLLRAIEAEADEQRLLADREKAASATAIVNEAAGREAAALQAQLAAALGRTDVYNEFIKRSSNWKNVYDPSTGFMRPKMTDGNWGKNFDPLKTEGQGFIEGNSWNYSLYVPHDVDAMIAAMGGKDQFAKRLESAFYDEFARFVFCRDRGHHTRRHYRRIYSRQ